MIKKIRYINVWADKFIIIHNNQKWIQIWMNFKKCWYGIMECRVEYKENVTAKRFEFFCIFQIFFLIIIKWNNHTGNQMKRDHSNGSQKWSYVILQYWLWIYKKSNMTFHCYINSETEKRMRMRDHISSKDSMAGMSFRTNQIICRCASQQAVIYSQQDSTYSQQDKWIHFREREAACSIH